MITIMKNNVHRLMTKPSFIITMLIMTIGAIAAALFFSSKTETAANIAVISEQSEAEYNIPALNITVLTEEPAVSELVSGSYDAVLTRQPDGTYEITTLKSDELKETILSLLETGTLPESTMNAQRGPGAMIIGFLLMFILMEASFLMFTFAEDKEHKQITRIVTTPVSMTAYLCAHFTFSFVILFVPTMVIISLCKLITGAELGFTFLQLNALMALICAFATGFALFMNSLTSKGDNANMSASSIIVMTSVLAGSFYSFEKGNKALEMMIKFLPQKAYLNIVDRLEQGMTFSDYRLSLLYVMVFLLLFIIFAIIKTKKDYIHSN